MQTIYLDISNKGVIPCIHAKQSEVGRKFLAIITDSGVPYEIQNNSVVSVWYEGASGQGNYTDIGNKSAISVTKNRITVELIAQMLAVPGNGVITVLINSVNGDQIGLWNIDYCVEKNAGVESEKAEDYYTAFSEAAAKLAKSAEEINSAIKAKNATAAGLIYPLASANVPSGFLLCDGAEYSRAEYAELFESIGTAYGSGDGSTTFNVPNLQTRVPVGVGDGYELGATGGEEKHQLTVEELPSHSHYQPVANILDGSSVVQDATVLYTSGEKQTSFIGRLQDESTGGDQPYNNMQPYTVVNYIISTGKKVEFVVGGGGCRIDDNTIGADAWSSKNIVDKLCPTFEKTGLFVQCEPVEGYPLNIVADTEKQVRFTVCGKNLYDKDTYPLEDNTIIRWDSGLSMTSATYASTGYIPVSHLRGQQIAIRHCPYVTANGSTSAGIAFYDDTQTYIKDGSGTNRETTTVPSTASFMRFSINKEAKYKSEAQIEIGSTVTDYEPYWEPKDIGEGSSVVVVAGKGVNSLFCYDGEQPVKITVTGKADPVAVIEKLTNAVISLGGNV